MTQTSIYLHKVNTGNTSQYAAYIMRPGKTELDLCWPSDHTAFKPMFNNDYDKAAKAMGFSIRKTLHYSKPKFTFNAKGTGHSHAYEAAIKILDNYCPAAGITGLVKVYTLNGSTPSPQAYRSF
jgi:hypothetical protein